jgi:tRNA 2-thiouridine synthesizing protein A
MCRKHTLDARRLLCPMPVIRLQDFVAGVPSGERVEVLCTDPGTRIDIPAWCRINGHQLVGIEENDGELVILVEVGDRVEQPR